MTRAEIINFLKNRPATVNDLAIAFERPASAIEEDIKHIRTSIRNDPEYELLVQRPTCEFCNFIFDSSHIQTPSRCPECGKEKINPPVFKIEKKKH